MNEDLELNMEDKEELEENQDAGVYVLKKPLTVDGENIKEIEYDLESVRPIQYKNLVKRISKKKTVAVPELDMDVQLGYFSLACGIPVSELMRMESTQDFAQIQGIVRSFLLGGSEPEEME